MDGKKKKGKKKKGNQNKSAEDSVPNAEEVVVQEQNHDTGLEQNHKHLQVLSSNFDAQSIAVSESDAEMERHKNYEAKFVMLQEEVKRLADEKNIWLEREIILEERIKHLQNEVYSCISNEAGLQEKLNDLKNRNDSLMQKEDILEEKVKHIEGTREAWSLKEISIMEMIARLEEVNTGLQEQVKELEESKITTAQENQTLMESISSLEIRMHHLEEASHDNSQGKPTKVPHLVEENEMYQTQAALAPVENPETENNYLDIKVNELQSVPDGHPDVTGVSIPEQDRYATSPVKSATPAHHVTEYNEKMFESASSNQSVVRNHEIYSLQDFGAVARVSPGQAPDLEESRRSEEIVQIPLDDTPVHRVESQPVINDENAAIPLSDAPLIGAPFRLISFMAKYVSGADLVNKNSTKGGQ